MGMDLMEDDFPLNPDEDTDTDFDGIGNNTDTDDDNDGVLDLRQLPNRCIRGK